MQNIYRKRKGGFWYIDKTIQGYGRLYESLRTKDKTEAERRAIIRLAEIEKQTVYGQKKVITFGEAVYMYVRDYGHKKSIDDDLSSLKMIIPHIEQLTLEQVHETRLRPIKAELLKTRKASTVNRCIAVVLVIMKHCVRTWRDELDRPYLDVIPHIEKIPEQDKKPAQVLTAMQLIALYNELNDDYRDFVLFALHTGLREKTQCRLRWSELYSEEGAQFFWVNPENMKSGRPFYCVLNSVAAGIVNDRRGNGSEYIFPSVRGGAYWKFNGKHFNNARVRAGLKGIVTWHSFRAMFATNLRRIGVSEEDRKTLLDHSGSVTSHYSVPQIMYLRNIVERLADEYPIR